MFEQHALASPSDLPSTGGHAKVSSRRMHLCTSMGAEELWRAQHVRATSLSKRTEHLTGSRYMQGFKCKVTGKTGQKKLAKANPPVWCADDDSKCRKGAKQMIVFNRV